MASWTKYLIVVCLLQPSLADTGYFWHITDFHVDRSYEGSQDSCNDVITDPGMYGDYECDAPYRLMNSSIRAMVEQGPNPEFILYSGDTVPHPKNYSGYTPALIIEYLQNVTNSFKSIFPNTPVVMALGNHDYYPRNQLPGSENEVYTAAAEMWSDWLGGQEAVDTFKKAAYYTRLMAPEKKLRVVVTNTNLYLKQNNATKGEADPGDQFVWLRKVLGNAKEKGEKVHLVVHVPPGVMPAPGNPRWLRDEQNTLFNDIVREFGDTIVGYYSCHEHFDTFRLYYDKGAPVAAMLLAPSVTPWRARITPTIKAGAHNPGVRKIFFDEHEGHLVDIEQYSLNLPQANDDENAQWVKLYSYHDTYGLDTITASSLHGLVERFMNGSLFEMYYRYNSVDVNHTSIGPCDSNCKNYHICSMSCVKYADFDRCYDNRTGVATCFSSAPTVITGTLIIKVLFLLHFL